MRGIRASLWVCLAFLSLFCMATATPAQAQARAGVQGGMSIDPDQVFFGGHVETSPLIDRLRFRPNVDIGLGDDITLIGFNFDFTYRFTENRPWNLYAGAGPALNWFDVNDNSTTDGGFNVLIGARQREGMFFEMKIGMVDSPDLKFGVGFTFR
jgi:hypothetical protein